MSGGSGPKAQHSTTPDPDAERVKDEEARRKAELEKRRVSGRTIATSSQGVMGAAPTGAPKLGGTA